MKAEPSWSGSAVFPVKAREWDALIPMKGAPR